MVEDNEVYERRIVAFGDILGWTDKCRDEKEKDTLFKAVIGIANHAKSFSPEVKNIVANSSVGLSQDDKEIHANIEFSHFSDSFALSAPVAYGKSLFDILSWANTQLLQKGFLVRGGVAIGSLCHSYKIIFGPALVEAVDIEKDAYYPRFLCSDELIKCLCEESYKNRFIFQDCHDDWVVNTACGNSQVLLHDMLAIIEERIQRSTASNHRRKWQYARTTLPRMFELKCIQV